VHRRASPTLIVALALLMSAPSIESAIRGALTIDALCVRLAMAVVVSYVGVRTLTSIVVGYATAPRWTRPERAERPHDGDMGT
jgi:hypothetical protein